MTYLSNYPLLHLTLLDLALQRQFLPWPPLSVSVCDICCFLQKWVLFPCSNEVVMPCARWGVGPGSAGLPPPQMLAISSTHPQVQLLLDFL